MTPIVSAAAVSAPNLTRLPVPKQTPLPHFDHS